jgi:mitogen-activated protein kinase organizer 1
MFSETQEIGEIKAHQAPIHSAIYSQDGQYILTASADRHVKLFSSTSGQEIQSYSGHGKAVLDVSLPAGSNAHFASCSGDRQVYVWDVQTAKTVQRFADHTQRVNSVFFNKDSTLVVSGSYDSTVKVWDVRQISKRPIQTLTEGKDSIESVFLNDYEIISCSVDGHLRTHDVRNRTVVHDYINRSLSSVSISNDKNCVLVSCLDSTLRLVDKLSGEMLIEYRGHLNEEYRSKATFTKQDWGVIAGSEDGRVFIWDLVEGNVVNSFSAHRKVVSSVEVNPKKNQFMTASFDGSIKLWA